MDANPLKISWDFSKRRKHQHLTFSVDGRLSLARSLRKVQWWSVSMVTRYDVIRSRWSSRFERKCIFLQLFSTIKVNLVAKIMQSAYLCVIVHVKQLPFLAVITWFLILGKIQDGGQDGDHCWWRHRPPAAPPFVKYTSSCYKTLGRGSGGSRGGVRGARSPLFFRSKWGPKGRKNLFGRPAPLLISRSGWPPPRPYLKDWMWGMILRVRPRIKWFFKTLAR